MENQSLEAAEETAEYVGEQAAEQMMDVTAEQAADGTPGATDLPAEEIAESVGEQSTPKSTEKPAGKTPDRWEQASMVRAKIQAQIELRDAFKLSISNNDIFKLNGLSKSHGYRMLKPDPPRPKEEPRGRHKILNKDHVREMERIRDFEGDQGRGVTWISLANAVGIEKISWRTIQRAMGLIAFSRCLTCNTTYVSPDIRQKRVNFCKSRLAAWGPVDWRKVRFSDAIAFDLGVDGQFRVVNKPGERFCSECADDADDADYERKADKTRVYAWAWVGWNFKSDLVFFHELPNHKDTKMSGQLYLERVLEPHVKPSIERWESFTIMEDGDSSIRSFRGMEAAKWLKDHNVPFYFNAPHSPDLSVIDDCWQSVKDEVRKAERPDEEALKAAALRGWKSVTQDFINWRAENMMERLQQVVDRDGRIG